MRTRLMASLRANVGLDEIGLALSLILLTAGLWRVVGAAALVAPGAILLFIFLPTRYAFVERPWNGGVTKPGPPKPAPRSQPKERA